MSNRGIKTLKSTPITPLVFFPHATYFFYTYCEKLKPHVGENGNIFALGLYDTLIMVAVVAPLSALKGNHV